MVASSATDTPYYNSLKANKVSPSSIIGINSMITAYAIALTHSSLLSPNSFISDVTTSKPRKGFDTSQLITSNSSSEPIYKLLNDTDWTTEFSKKLRDLSTLPSNWDSYGAEPPNEVALFWAFEILDVLSRKGFSPTTVTPSVENGIGISFICHNKYADIECFNEGSILAVTSDGRGNPEVWEVEASKQGLISAIERIHDFFQ